LGLSDTYPGSLSERVQAKLVGDFGSVQGVLRKLVLGLSCRLGATYWKILLVGEDQQESITEFILVQHALQLFPSLDNTISVVGVDNEDDTLSVLEVVSPQRTDLVLSTNIPHGELNVLVLDCLDVEAW